MDHASAAQAAVLDTNELLENILLQVPLRELLCCMRVWRKWYRVCRQDPTKVSKALFFKPFKLTVTAKTEFDCDASRNWGSSWQPPHAEHIAKQLIINPFIDNDDMPHMHSDPGGMRWTTGEGMVWRILHEDLVVPGPESDTNNMRILHRADVSWKSMLFLQHGIRNFQFRCSKEGYILVHNPLGINIGDVVNALRDHMTTCYGCYLEHEVEVESESESESEDEDEDEAEDDDDEHRDDMIDYEAPKPKCEWRVQSDVTCTRFYYGMKEGKTAGEMYRYLKMHFKQWTNTS